MKVNTNQQQRVSEQSKSGGKSTFIDPNPRRERETLDKYGNVIDPRTKQIIKKAEDNK